MSARRRFGSLRHLPSGRWQARYSSPADERITAPATFATKGDAQRWLSAAETDLARGDWHDPRLGEIPFDEWAQRWLATKRPRLAASTASVYHYLLRVHVLPRFGDVPVGRITAVDVQAWLAALHAESGLSPNSVAKTYRLLKGVLDGALEAGLIPRSPCVLTGAGTERNPEMKIATPEQVAAIAAAAGPRWEALILTAAYTGLRWGELAGLHRCDVDLDASTLRVVRQLREVNGQFSHGPPKTAAGRRTVGIPLFVGRALAAHMDLYTAPGDEGLVFPAQDKGPMRRSNFRRRVWEPATAEAGVSGLRFHDLRHTAATLAAASGTSLKALMARLGHASAAAALRYQHVLSGQDAEIVQYLEQFDQTPSVPTNDRQDPSAMGTQWARREGGRDPAIGQKPVTRGNVVGAEGLEPPTPSL